MGNKGGTIFVIFIIIGVGLGLMAMAYFEYKEISDLKNNGIKTKGVITNLSKRMKQHYHTVYVTFVTEKGDNKTSIIRNYRGFSAKGEVVEIYYHPADPDKIISDYDDENYTVFMIVGALFFTVGVFFTWHTIRKSLLISKGNRIMADIYDITVYKGNSYMIHAAYTHRGQKYTFKSQLINFDPSPFLNTQVLVYVDPKNYKKYYVDAESLVDKQGSI